MTSTDPLRIALVVGSTRPGRRAGLVAEWVQSFADARPDTGQAATFTVLDLADFDLPLLDEPEPAAIGSYRNAHTRRWAAAVAQFDGFVFVTPEYNHSFPAALKNAIDYLYAEWNDKAAAFVSYGLTGGTRAVEQLRLVLAEVQVACVRSQVAMTLSADFVIEDIRTPGTCAPGDHHGPIADRMLGELLAWAGALRSLRQPERVDAR